jgi:iron complex outermembrane receptor protein
MFNKSASYSLLVKSLFFVSLFLGSISLKAQQGSISGKITDKNGEAIPGITVIIKSTGQGAAADADGRFFIRNLDAGDYVLVRYQNRGFRL